jgi:hypothetical protein
LFGKEAGVPILVLESISTGKGLDEKKEREGNFIKEEEGKQ